MHHDAADATRRTTPLERHRTRGADVAGIVLYRRLNRVARTNPAAILGVLAFWLGPRDTAAPAGREP